MHYPPDPNRILWSELAPLLRVVHELEVLLAMLADYRGVVAGVIALAITVAVLVAVEFRARVAPSHSAPVARDPSCSTTGRWGSGRAAKLKRRSRGGDMIRGTREVSRVAVTSIYPPSGAPSMT